MRLLLVRHGQSVWNADRRLQGQADIALSEAGRAQARALAPVIAAFAPERAVSSDLARARETAALLGHPRAVLLPELREHSVGLWEGRAIPSIMAETPGDYALWRGGRFTPEGGEPWESFTARVTSALRAEHARGDCRNLLVVCHGGVIRAVLHGLLGLAPTSLIPVAPASLTTLMLRAGDPSPRLELLNYRPGEIDLDAPD
ncbi:histidine phosphatase family protein [Pseudogemmobacter sonorensis]|uniref:histidine phosphatase family protein n=1 Tax=Pseudogemmobacter sonorensis TaxID=2989681 RepID=UPI0036B088D2